MERFEGKVALITGGAGDIGRATCQRLLEEGAKVVLFARSADKLEITVKDMVELGYDSSRVKYFAGDVVNLKDCVNASNYTVKEFGRVDILVASAGILRHHPIDELTEKDWNDVIDTNLTGVYHSAKAVVEVMKKQKYGRMVLISSIGGRTGRPGVGVNYAAAKAGIVGMTQLLGYELGPWNITVNCVAPGPLKGTMFGTLPKEIKQRLESGARIARVGELSEIAAAIAYLASDEAAWTTGEILDVNGGLQY